MIDYSWLRRLAASAVTATVAVALTACSSSGHPAAGAGQPQARSSGTSSQHAGSGAAKTGRAARCEQLTVAQIRALGTDPVTKSPPRAAGLNDHPGQECAFDGPDDGPAVDVTVLDGSFGQQAYASDVRGHSNGSIALPGVGDKASYNKGDLAVSAISGSLYCSVVAEGNDFTGVGTWESDHGGTSTLTDPIVAAVNANLGTICNTIFGSGNTTPDLAPVHAALAAS